MPRFYEITTLDDAYSSLHDATGLPNTISGRDKAQLFFRVAVIFGWLSAESSAKFFMRDWVTDGFREPANMKFSDKICMLVALRKIKGEALEPLMGSAHTKEERKQALRQAITDTARASNEFSKQKQLFDLAKFKSQRELRSDITHSNTDKELTAAEVRDCLDYCTSLIELAGGIAVRKETFYTDRNQR